MKPSLTVVTDAPSADSALLFPDGWASRAYTALCQTQVLAAAVRRLVAEVNDGLISDDNALLAAAIVSIERVQEMADEAVGEVNGAPNDDGAPGHEDSGGAPLGLKRVFSEAGGRIVG